MPIVREVRTLGDLPEFERIAEIGSRWEEPLQLRGSTARRLVCHLLRGDLIDHSLPARCSPPPSDVDLLFETDDSDRIGNIVSEIRESAPIFQALRVEASSVPRIESLTASLEEHVTCPVFGISLPTNTNEGFSDKTGRGIEELANGTLSFKLSDTALRSPESLDDDVRFHVYSACLVFTKALYEHGNRQTGRAMETVADYCSRNLSFITRLTESGSREEDGTYYRNRLLSLAYSMRAATTTDDFNEDLAELLPLRIGERIQGRRADAPLLHISKAQLIEPRTEWRTPRLDEIEDHVDLSFASAMACSPSIPLRLGDAGIGTFADCLIPLTGEMENLAVEDDGEFCAALRVTLRSSGASEACWLPAFCEGHRRSDKVNLRIALDDVVDLVSTAKGIDDSISASLQIYLLGKEAAEMEEPEPNSHSTTPWDPSDSQEAVMTQAYQVMEAW